MRRRDLLLAGAGLLLTACTPTDAPAAKIGKPSGLPVLLESAPDLTGVKTWFNSTPLTLQQMRGEPFLMVFWTYT